VVRFDSFYAANIAQGIWRAGSNEELADRVRSLTTEVSQHRQLTWVHVYGHRGFHDNELADRAADLGCQGKVSLQSRRWAAPPPALAPQHYMATDFCKKCGTEVLTRDMKWHFRRCTVEGRAIPEGMEKCRKCGDFVKHRRPHETRCRGSALANRTCNKCGKVFPEPPEGMLSRPLGNHEKLCQGDKGPAAPAHLGAPAAAVAFQAAAKPQGKAKAGAKAGGRGKLRAKTKAKAKVKAKAKGAAKAKGIARGRAAGVGRGRGRGRLAARPRAKPRGRG
jgi:hypothetical protein